MTSHKTVSQDDTTSEELIILDIKIAEMPLDADIKSPGCSISKSVPQIGTIKTAAGGKDYHEELKECLCLKYKFISIDLPHSKMSDLNKHVKRFEKSCISPKFVQKNKALKRKGIGFVTVKESDLNTDEILLLKTWMVNGSDTGQNIPTISLKKAFQILAEDEGQGQILFLVTDEDAQTITFVGSEEILEIVRLHLEEPQKGDDGVPKDLKETDQLPSRSDSYQSRGNLAKDIVESMMERAGNHDYSIASVLEECVCNNLKKCEEWTASLLVDLLTMNSSEQHIKDINEHVMDYLTQCFRQKHTMLALRDQTEHDSPPASATDHVAVLHKLSPTLSRQFKLEGTNILDYMHEQDALSDTERQSILAHPTEKRKNEAFIDHLCANYSMTKFKEVVLPILQKDENHRHIAAAIDKELQRHAVRPIETKCTFCKVKGLIDLRALSEPLLSLHSITQAVRRDLSSSTMPSRLKWGEILENVDEESFLTALKKKYPHFHEEFQTTGHSPLKCCCDDEPVSLKDIVTDVANMDDLVSEIGSRVSYGLRDSVMDRVGSMPSSPFWKVECIPGYRNVCGICQQMIRDTRKLSCGHVFCKLCIGSVFRVVKVCPVCGSKLGPIKGTMPPGRMTHTIESQSLPGFAGFETIAISYNIDNGIQMDEHPYPGQAYRGIKCIAYLPNSLDGQLVLMLLQTAWERCLTFTIRQSVSSSVDFVLSWNGISHKTNRTGGPGNHGYPDADYLSRIRKELAEQGILADDLRSTMV